MQRLVSLALFDPDGQVAPFVRRTIEQLATPDTLLVASATHPLTPEDAQWVRRHGELVERENIGLDLYGHRLVIEAHGLDVDEVIITNDTFALLEPLAEIERRIDSSASFWGLTASAEVAPHVQSYYVHFRSAAVRNPSFAAHWRRVEPQSRRATIRQNEVGLSRALCKAGLSFDVAYRPSVADRMLALRRCWAHPGNPRGLIGQWNPSMVLADAALDGRMPVVKMSALRQDPYRIGATALLGKLEERFPESMSGVRGYLERTAPAYG